MGGKGSLPIFSNLPILRSGGRDPIRVQQLHNFVQEGPSCSLCLLIVSKLSAAPASPSSGIPAGIRFAIHPSLAADAAT